MKGSNPASNRYLRYRMQGGSGVWRWNEVWEVARTGEFSFDPILMICSSGEVETAIHQKGKGEFMGGSAHGNEELVAISILMDGAPLVLGDSGRFRCQRMEFAQTSDLYEVGTVPAKSKRVAQIDKRWVFEHSTVELSQTVHWNEAITLGDCYLAMLPLLRTSSGIQVTDKGYRSPLYAEEDISSPGFKQVYSTSSVLRASGPNGHSAEVEMLEGWDKPKREANISNSSTYNKFYFDFTGAGYTTAIGEQMKVRARFRLDTTN